MSATESSGKPAREDADPPGALPSARRLALYLRRPVERFLAIEAASGIVLLLAAAAALVWANSPWRHGYHALWETLITVSAGAVSATGSLHFVVNDVLMAVFFLVVGIEIGRELRAGELSDLRRAALPAVAALGGMLVPAAIYVAANPDGDGARGWGVPMATDIAFAVGVLALLGRRVPSGLRVLLLALAIIDDIGAIIVIAVFYSGGASIEGLAIAGAGIAGLIALKAIGARGGLVYLMPAAVLWYGVLRTGVHPTIAGVITGLLIPGVRWHGHEELPPASRLAEELHPWVAFVIMPLFALANAGVDLGTVDFGAAPAVAWGIAGGLVVGKLVGIMGFSVLAVKLGFASLPTGVTIRSLAVLGLAAGIGFTMALFIAGLAFAGHPELYSTAQLAVLSASAFAAVATLVAGRALLPRSPEGVCYPAPGPVPGPAIEAQRR